MKAKKKIPGARAACAALTCTFLLAPFNSALAAQEVNGSFLLPTYQPTDKSTDLDNKILTALSKSHIVGLSAAVIKGDKIQWLKSYGWADLRTNKAATPDTIYRVASISKMFTATALMQLYEKGKFGLDDDISKYLGYTVRNPKYPDKKITFRHLLTHTSSILDGGYERLIDEDPALLRQATLQDLLVPGGKWCGYGSYGDYAPGEKFNYSNLGTGVVGSLVEKISGERFDQYCINHIFKPMGMDASFDPADLKKFENLGVIYRPIDSSGTYFKPQKDDYKGVRPEHVNITAPMGNALGWSPAGSVRISARDLSKFMAVHMNGGAYNGTRLLKSDTVDLMHQMHWFGDDPENFYKQKGLNFQVTDDLVQGRRLTGHTADAYGLIGDAYFDQDSKVGVVMLFSGGTYGNGNPFYKVDTSVATTLIDEFSSKDTNVKRDTKGKLNDNVITVNNRKIVLPAAATKKGASIFIPEISVADALAATIDQDKKSVTYVVNAKTVIFTQDCKDIQVNGKKVTLPEAPYKNGEHIMIPFKEAAQYLDVKATIQFSK